VNNKFYIYIFGLDKPEASQKIRQIREALDGLGIEVSYTIIVSDNRELFKNAKESHAAILYQPSNEADFKKAFKTMMDTVSRLMDIILLPTSGIISKNSSGIF